MEGRPLAKHRLPHVAHKRAAKDEEELRVGPLMVDEALQQRIHVLALFGEVGVLVDEEDVPLRLRTPPNEVKQLLEALELDRPEQFWSERRQYEVAHRLELLLLTSLQRHERHDLDGRFVDELVDEGGLADPSSPVDDRHLKTRCVQLGLQGRELLLSANESPSHAPSSPLCMSAAIIP